MLPATRPSFGRDLVYPLSVVPLAMSYVAAFSPLWLRQVLMSVAWLRQFRFGPIEWLWRSLTYGRREPLARRNA
jgi:uncharacterized membrane protein YeiB